MLKLGNVFILGDSYSTFEDEIPKGYDTWYYHAMSTPTDVATADQTWWKRLLSCTDSHLVLNESFSGTTICHTGYDGKDCSDRSFVTRFDRLAADGYFQKNQVDTVFIFGGTNDNWANSPLGERKYADWQTEDLYSFLPAVCYLVNKVKTTLPNARVIYIINTELKPEIVEGIHAACEVFGAEVVQLHDLSTQAGHPDQKGMIQIKDQILSYLKRSNIKE